MEQGLDRLIFAALRVPSIALFNKTIQIPSLNTFYSVSTMHESVIGYSVYNGGQKKDMVPTPTGFPSTEVTSFINQILPK